MSDPQRETRWGGLPWLIVGVAVIVLLLIALAWALGGGEGPSVADSASDIEDAETVYPDTTEPATTDRTETDRTETDRTETEATPEIQGDSPGEAVASAVLPPTAAREARAARNRLGETQYHYPSRDPARAPYGTEGAHCFVGETCQTIPPPSGFVDSLLGGGGTSGSSGSGVGGGLVDAVSGLGSGGRGTTARGSGVSATGRAGRALGDAISGSGQRARGTAARARADFARRRAIRRARNDALRVPTGQPGAHCFTGEDCPALPVGSQASPQPVQTPTTVATAPGPTVLATAPGAGGIAAAARTPACAECLARLPAGTHVIAGPTCPLPAPAG